MRADALSQTFAALADPTRRAILKRLAAGPANVKELSRPFDMSGPAVCKHLRVLERAGLVRRRREAQSRPCELDPAPLKEIAAWTDAYREFLGRERRSAGCVSETAAATHRRAPCASPQALI